jgi:hypothetical protein
MSTEDVLNHSGSGQFEKMKVQQGDVVWVITVRPGGEVVLAGRMQVGERIDYPEAVRRFGNNVWEAKHHIVAESGTEEEFREVSLKDIALQLRFQSSSNKDRLTILNGRVSAQQLQAMRRLDPASIPLLETKWYGVSVPSVHEIEQQISMFGAGYGNPETNRKVERAAVEFVMKWYKIRGWKVQSVEAKKCGYDLLCTKQGSEEHVEVKGVQGTGRSFIITAGEVRRAHTDQQFVICVVTSALSNTQQMSRYSGEEFTEKFELDEIAFRARPRV